MLLTSSCFHMSMNNQLLNTAAGQSISKHPARMDPIVVMYNMSLGTGRAYIIFVHAYITVTAMQRSWLSHCAASRNCSITRWWQYHRLVSCHRYKTWKEKRKRHCLAGCAMHFLQATVAGHFSDSVNGLAVEASLTSTLGLMYMSTVNHLAIVSGTYFCEFCE